MLTRLEVDGFKNLQNVSIEFGPFTCIAGANAAGKSNVFDAIEFISLLASRPLVEAAQEIRSARADRSGDPADLFWQGSGDRRRLMRLAAEMIIPRLVEDDVGRQAEASITFVRYQLEIGYQPVSGLGKVGGLVLESEWMLPIRLGDAGQHLGFPHSAKRFRRAAVAGRRARPFISTEDRGDDRVINIHQDGGSRGKPIPVLAARAPATLVSTATDVDHPTILAARREMQDWHRLALEPSALRESDRYADLLRAANGQHLAEDGRHLPAALYRIATQRLESEEEPDPADMYARVATRLNSLVDVGVRSLWVDTDDREHRITLRLKERNGLDLPARSLSDGTLRFLALAVLLETPDRGGVYCMEEPENGMHPASLPAMVEILRDLAVDPREAPGADNPLRQVIANTHSPVLVQLLDPDELLLASTGIAVAGIDDPSSPVAADHQARPSADDAIGGGRETVRVLRLTPLKGSWRAGRQPDPPCTMADMLPYLTSPVGAQLALDVDPA